MKCGNIIDNGPKRCCLDYDVDMNKYYYDRGLNPNYNPKEDPKRVLRFQMRDAYSHITSSLGAACKSFGAMNCKQATTHHYMTEDTILEKDALLESFKKKEIENRLESISRLDNSEHTEHMRWQIGKNIQEWHKIIIDNITEWGLWENEEHTRFNHIRYFEIYCEHDCNAMKDVWEAYMKVCDEMYVCGWNVQHDKFRSCRIICKEHRMLFKLFNDQWKTKTIYAKDMCWRKNSANQRREI